MTKILLCEDEDVMITAIEFRLQKIGCQSLKVKNVDAAKQTLMLQQADLAIVSLTLPTGDGLSLLDWIRAEIKPAIPIVIISNLEQEEEVMTAFDKGADDFITKPFKPTELILRVTRLLDKYSKK